MPWPTLLLPNTKSRVFFDLGQKKSPLGHKKGKAILMTANCIQKPQ